MNAFVKLSFSFHFQRAFSIACSITGMVYIRDIRDNCIGIFTADGESLRSFKLHEIEPQWPISSPRIAIDHD